MHNTVWCKILIEENTNKIKLYQEFIISRERVSNAVLIITASHQTLSGKFWCLSGQNKFDLTHLLYIINGKVSVFLEDKVMPRQISTLIINTDNVVLP